MTHDTSKFSFIKGKLEKELSKQVFEHSLEVTEYALKLADAFCYEEKDKVELAGLLHDNCKGLPFEELQKLANSVGYRLSEIDKLVPQTLHAKVGALRAIHDFGVPDKDIFEAIFYHSTGKQGLGVLGRIIYCADKLAPSRNYEEVDRLRKLEKDGLSKMCLETVRASLAFLLKRDSIIEPSTLEFYNELLVENFRG